MISLVCACATILSGCLMPPDVEYVAPPANQPPYVVQGIYSPPINDYVLMGTGTGCGDEAHNQAFTVLVKDPDIPETLYWRAFLDWPREKNQDFQSGSATNVTAGVTVGFVIYGGDGRFAAITDRPHIVELMISDRPFFTDERSPVGHAVQDGAETLSVVWTVQYFGGSACE